MALNDDNEENIEKSHKDLCLELNMDTSAATASWDSYNSIRENCTLEGNPKHWLCCSLYVACRQDMTPTVGTSEALVEGNCVSLTRLLRLCNISLGEFFKKVKTWAELTNMPESFMRRIDRLEKSIAVSVILFQKFQALFEQLFVKPNKESLRINKSRKQNRNIKCSSARLSQFCWVLFVCIKGEHPHKSDDLICLYHLLLCCIDLLYSNAIAAGRTDLINSSFSGLPINWNTPNWTAPTKPISILNVLCSAGDCAPALEDTLHTMEYTLKPILKRYFKESILMGDGNNFTKILDVENFEKNLSKLNNLYDTYVLSVGEFDERILFDDYAAGSQERNSERMSATLTPHTPLTNQRYLNGRGREYGLSPVTKATQTLTKLQEMLEPYRNGPTNKLKEMFAYQEVDPMPKLIERIKKCSNTFTQNYFASFVALNRVNNRGSITPNPASDITLSKQRLQLSTSLYWRLLENILRDELRRKKTLNMSQLLDVDIFHLTLFACCVEIIIFAFGSQQHKFPWILECFKIHAFDFYKIIEIVVRTEEKLTREIVKLLNNIEEQILGTKAWESNSVVWDKLNGTPGSVPQSQDVALPELIMNDSNTVTGNTPISNPIIKKIATTPISGVPNSPVSFASERFQSPVSEQARKQLFPSTSTLAHQKQIENQDNCSTDQIETVRSNISSPESIASSRSHQANIKKLGSLGLFFRKFYQLASIRLEKLCKELQLLDNELQCKIWTCFEYAITNYTELMKDRHLDQILMCTVYAICKVCGSKDQGRSFTEIMKNYRLQPQSNSNVYRSVLISKRTDPGNPSRPDIEDRGDLIKFYNQVYVVTVQEFALRFSRNDQNVPALSPLPVGRSPCLSPRRVSDQHALYVTSLDSRVPPKSGNCHVYKFSRSPAKSLREINAAMNNTSITKGGFKRSVEHLQEGIIEANGGDPSAIRIPTLSNNTTSGGLFSSKKLRGLINDRQVK